MSEQTKAQEDVKTSLRLRTEVYDLWDRLAAHMGIKKAQVFNKALYDLARREGVPIHQEEIPK